MLPVVWGLIPYNTSYNTEGAATPTRALNIDLCMIIGSLNICLRMIPRSPTRGALMWGGGGEGGGTNLKERFLRTGFVNSEVWGASSFLGARKRTSSQRNL